MRLTESPDNVLSDNDLNKEIETERVEFPFKIHKDTWTGEINMHLLPTP